MDPEWTRRGVLGAAVAGLASIAAGGRGQVLNSKSEIRNGSGAAQSATETFTYKTVGGCQIKLDVYGAAAGAPRPLAVWIHGGALIMGNRQGIDGTLLGGLLKAGYVVASIDYRLAPETKLPAILEDVKDALGWLRTEGPKRFGARDDRVAVLGGSAGGYLTLTCGYLIEPRPTVLASYWGYGDIAGPWYSRQPLVTEAEARRAVGTAEVSEPPRGNQRGRFYLYCRQNGLWPKEVTGHDPDTEPKAFDRFCPVRNVSAKYPPTLLIHGTKDADVPHEQSVLMDEQLTRHRIPHEFTSVPGGGHGLGNLDKSVTSKIHDHVIAYVRRYTT
jgi:acetyl esterase/lipase